MMRDHQDDAHEGAAGRGGAGDRPLADREVPLPSLASADRQQAVVHAWLDGEVAVELAHDSAPERVRFWQELTVQVEVHRARSAPASLLQAVMAALPSVPPTAPLADMPTAELKAETKAAAPKGEALRKADRSGGAPR